MVSTPTVAQAAAQLLERCRQEKHLSIAGVAAALGYRSPNSVERIAKGSAGHTACCKFLESARRVYPELFPGEDGGSVHGRAAENAWLRLMRGERGPAEASTRLYRTDGTLLGSIGEYYAGLGVSSVRVMLLVRGVSQVLCLPLSKGASAAISGVAGIGHILTGVGLVLLLLTLRRVARD